MADHRHKRDTNARIPLPFRRARATTVAAPLAVLATGAVVGIGVLAANPSSPVASADEPAPAPTMSVSAPSSPDLQRLTLSRGAARRVDALEQRQAERRDRPTGKQAVRWTTGTLNLWTTSGEQAEKVGEVSVGSKVEITGRRRGDRVQIVYKQRNRWVTEGYLTDEKPPAAGAGLSHAPCPDPGVERGLRANAVYVYRSVCHAFPQITRYGGWDNHGEHRSGRALDIMTSDVGLGTAIAEFLRAHASELHLYDVIWRQHIWTPVRAGEGWRAMPSRGSATANHYDHVHVSTY